MLDYDTGRQQTIYSGQGADRNGQAKPESPMESATSIVVSLPTIPKNCRGGPLPPGVTIDGDSKVSDRNEPPKPECPSGSATCISGFIAPSPRRPQGGVQDLDLKHSPLLEEIMRPIERDHPGQCEIHFRVSLETRRVQESRPF